MSPIGHGSMSVIKCIVWITQWSWTTMDCPFIWIVVILALSIMWLFFHELDLYNTNFFVHIDKYLSTLLGEACWKVACIMGKATWSCYFATKKRLFRIGRYYLPIIQHVEGLFFKSFLFKGRLIALYITTSPFPILMVVFLCFVCFTQLPFLIARSIVIQPTF